MAMAMAQEVAIQALEARLQKALERVRVVLDAAKSPLLAGDVHHQYEDKYCLTEHMTNAAVASQLNCFATLGVGADQLSRLREWAQASTVSLQFRSEERCTFLREVTRDIESATRTVDEFSVGGLVTAEVTHKVVTTVTEYFWQFEVSYELYALRGTGDGSENRMLVLSRVGRDELMTSSSSAPKPEAKVPAFQREANVTWLFQQLPSGSDTPNFKVDRDHKGCHTPRRNPDIDLAMRHFGDVSVWAAQVATYLSSYFTLNENEVKALSLNGVEILSVLPLLLDAEPADEQRILGPGDANRLLADEARALKERRSEMAEVFPTGDAVATAAEAQLVQVFRHIEHICSRWEEVVDYIENLIRKQLIAAIGKEVSPADFAEYMRFHNRKLFAEAYLPKPFSFAVRRSSQHAPEGTVSVEQEVTGLGGDGNIAQPIFTLCARAEGERLMSMPINASTSIRFGGDRYLHAWLSHQFSGHSGQKLSLVSRAQQFSSLLVVVGSITSATTLDPKYAAIVRNKDELTIPLELSTIPSPKEFKDAIESLSPEQQAFAKAFRCLQLESTLFGVAILQIKPQLEKVLNLPPDSLSKEIQLTQDLMELFIQYQIPSDLLSFDVENITATHAQRVEAVKNHVDGMLQMINAQKVGEAALKKMEYQYKDCKDKQMEKEGRARDKEEEKKCKKKHVKHKATGRAASSGAAVAPTPTASASNAAPAPKGTPQPAEQAQARHEATRDEQSSAGKAATDEQMEERDCTQLPQEIERQLEEFDTDGAVRPTIISAGECWSKRSQPSLLARPTTSELHSDEQKREKDAAFDLLDALTKSGALCVDHASLHVMVAATHCFDKSVMETVVQDNTNPIDKVELSTLIMAAAVHAQPAAALVRGAQLPRVQEALPRLFLQDSAS